MRQILTSACPKPSYPLFNLQVTREGGFQGGAGSAGDRARGGQPGLEGFVQDQSDLDGVAGLYFGREAGDIALLELLTGFAGFTDQNPQDYERLSISTRAAMAEEWSVPGRMSTIGMNASSGGTLSLIEPDRRIPM